MTDKAPTPGSLPPQKVEDRENVGTVLPDDYPKKEREDGDLTGASNRGRRANKVGSGPVTGSGAGAGGHKPIRTDNGPKTGADAPVGGSR